MGKKKREKIPLSLEVQKTKKKSLKKKEMRKVTSDFHRLSSQLEQLKQERERKRANGLPIEEEEREITEIEEGIRALGGRTVYQQASHQATSAFSTSKWVMGDLQRRGYKEKGTRKRVLEIGAINTQLQLCSWLSVRSIDLLSSSPLIEAVDFFAVPAGEVYDVIVCSMVVNCVPAPPLRYQMLHKIRLHLASESSLLYLMLPLSCFQHSRYLSQQQFEELLLPLIGFKILLFHRTPKIGFWVCCRQSPQEHLRDAYQNRELPHQERRKSRNYDFNIEIS
jgi:25S rRNA (adenine2142-N1)-methyltransferase